MVRHIRERIQPAPWERTLYILAFSQLVVAIGFSTIFPFLPLYVEELGSTMGLSIELLSGLVFSAQAVTMMIASPIWGGLADRFGRKLMILRSAFGGAVLVCLMAFVRSAEQLVVLRAIQGAVTGVVAANNALAAAVIPRKNTGYAMGLLQVSMGVGVALGPVIGGALADAFGYSIAFYGTAVLLFISGLMVMYGIQEDFHPDEVKKEAAGGMAREWRQILGTRGVAATYGMRFMNALAGMIIVPIAPLFIKELMQTEEGLNTFVGLVIGASSGATTLSSIYLGRLGDRAGHRRVLITSVLAAGVLYLPQSLVTAEWQLLILQAVTGIAIGGVIPSISALLANYTQPGHEGAVYGLDNSINAAGRAVAPLLGSAVAAWFSLRATFTSTAVILFVAFIMANTWIPRLPEEGKENRTG
jgi:DHA1 family multidrug resistance protein-like MFS transporter